MSLQFCKLALNDSKFLKYKPSEMASASVIIASNIFMEENGRDKNGNLSKELAFFFSKNPKN